MKYTTCNTYRQWFSLEHWLEDTLLGGAQELLFSREA